MIKKAEIAGDFSFGAIRFKSESRLTNILFSRLACFCLRYATPLATWGQNPYNRLKMFN